MKTIDKNMEDNDFIRRMIKENRIEEMVPFEIDGTLIKFNTQKLEQINLIEDKTNRNILEITKKILIAYSNFENLLLENFIVLEREKIYMDRRGNLKFIIDKNANTGKKDIKKLIIELMVDREIKIDNDLKILIKVLNEIFKNGIDNERIIDIINKVSSKCGIKNKKNIFKSLKAFFRKTNTKTQKNDIKIRFEFPEK